jgi:3-deoxy-D-manno-octulosonic-acid transferase
MSLPEAAYAAVIRLLRTVSPALSLGDGKLARGVRGRRGAVGRLEAWGRTWRDPTRPLIWLHAPSVGEGLQARAVLAALKAGAEGDGAGAIGDDSTGKGDGRGASGTPPMQSVFTYFSPSAEGWASRIGADVTDYLPWDVRSDVGRVLDALRPSVLAFTKTEVWPALSREAAARGIPMVLIAGTLPETSSRLSPVARALLAPAFSRLTAVHAVSPADAERFGELGVRAEQVIVTGDPGVDSAADRVRGADPSRAPLCAFTSNRPRLIAGSTWPADEAVVLGAMRELRGTGARATSRRAVGVAGDRTASEAAEPSDPKSTDPLANLQLVIAPHEPNPAHQVGLIKRLSEDGFAAASLTEVEAAGSDAAFDVVVVDRVGVLAPLYTLGSVAYVGGGFHDQGLHSVLEPAAAGIPVCFGPLHDNSLAASELLQVGAGREVKGAGELARAIAEWLARDASAGRAAGDAANRYIDAHRGAAARSARLLREMIAADDFGAGR